MEPLRFKYRPSGWEGGGIRLFAKKGEICDESVTLGRRKILLGSLVEIRADGKELLLSVSTPYGRDDVQIAIAPGRFDGAWNLRGESRARRVKEAIDRPLSRFRLQQHRRGLGAEDGQVEARSEVCPHCLALVDLSGLSPSRQVFCPCCQTLGTLEPTPRSEERYFTICPRCHYFACPEPFTSIRAAYLILVFLWERETMVGCGACMRAEAWVNLRGNLLSVIGASRLRPRIRPGSFPGLASVRAVRRTRRGQRGGCGWTVRAGGCALRADSGAERRLGGRALQPSKVALRSGGLVGRRWRKHFPRSATVRTTPRRPIWPVAAWCDSVALRTPRPYEPEPQGQSTRTCPRLAHERAPLGIGPGSTGRGPSAGPSSSIGGARVGLVGP